jgi:hypothetical protein
MTTSVDISAPAADRAFLEYDEVYWTADVQDHPYTPAAGTTCPMFELGTNDPIERWAYERARLREERLQSRLCAFGRCTELWDPLTGENTGGFGPSDCECQR